MFALFELKQPQGVGAEYPEAPDSCQGEQRLPGLLEMMVSSQTWWMEDLLDVGDENNFCYMSNILSRNLRQIDSWYK